MAEPYRASTPLATGTVTFLFSDIEGSTALWEQDGARMSQALAAHDLLARRAVESHHGVVVKMTGGDLRRCAAGALRTARGGGRASR